MKNTFNTFDESCYNTLIGNTFYVKDCNIKLHCYDRSLCITDITDALKTGKEVISYSIDYWQEGNVAAHNIIAEFNYDLRALYNALAELDFPPTRWGKGEFKWEICGGEFTVSERSEQAIRIWSPFNLEFIKPLKEAPKKWTVKHALRAIINGQIDGLKCNGKYTDDYAFDAAYDFFAGEIKGTLGFAQKILESPRGWWVSKAPSNGGWVSLCCHSFDSNEFKPSI